KEANPKLLPSTPKAANGNPERVRRTSYPPLEGSRPTGFLRPALAEGRARSRPSSEPRVLGRHRPAPGGHALPFLCDGRAGHRACPREASDRSRVPGEADRVDLVRLEIEGQSRPAPRLPVLHEVRRSRSGDRSDPCFVRREGSPSGSSPGPR